MNKKINALSAIPDAEIVTCLCEIIKLFEILVNDDSENKIEDSIRFFKAMQIGLEIQKFNFCKENHLNQFDIEELLK